jgi:hypothetical protein
MQFIFFKVLSMWHKKLNRMHVYLQINTINKMYQTNNSSDNNGMLSLTSMEKTVTFVPTCNHTVKYSEHLCAKCYKESYSGDVLNKYKVKHLMRKSPGKRTHTLYNVKIGGNTYSAEISNLIYADDSDNSKEYTAILTFLNIPGSSMVKDKSDSIIITFTFKGANIVFRHPVDVRGPTMYGKCITFAQVDKMFMPQIYAIDQPWYMYSFMKNGYTFGANTYPCNYVETRLRNTEIFIN